MHAISKRAMLGGMFALTIAATSANAADQIQTLRPGELKVAYRTDDRPVSFIQNGVPSGFMVDLVNSIGDRLGLKVTFVSTSFAAMLPAVKNEQYDTAAFGVIVTPERKNIVDFTKPVGYAQARLVSRKVAAIDTVEHAPGKTIAITQGSALIPLLNRIAPGVNVREFPNIAASLNALLASQVDGLFTGLTTADELVERHRELAPSQVVISGVNALPVAKSNPALLDALNGAITGLMNDGTYTRLFHHWNPTGVEIPEPLFADYPKLQH